MDGPDERPFSERVARVKLAYLVSLPTAQVEKFAQQVEEALNETGGTLIHTEMSSGRLFIERE